MAETSLTPANYEFVARLLREQCGLILESGKEYLVKSRLWPLAQRHDIAGVDQLIERLRSSGANGLLTEVVEAMVTTETSFFRDIHPFETLRKILLPELIERRRSQRQLNIWCAASASGQEPYSIAILLHEYFPELAAWNINFSATDISHEMLTRSRAGRYSQVEVNRGLPTPLLLKWFRQEGGAWQLDDRVRHAVRFSHLNLAQSWPAMTTWDLVFLRNVMIYFENDLKSVILNRVARLMRPDGYLVLGGAETTLNLSDSFSRVEALKSGFYQLKSSFSFQHSTMP
ncbi:protein-glutamate O-methyltransferase CheR [Anatilimnocola sp. NA78]|uniref:CheR family methyltransferase n=1 Tax=Anatilimnocola sp. NA78 TaxID=3415683 RepID=UPI003CE59943